MTLWETTALQNPSPSSAQSEVTGVLVVDDDAVIRSLLDTGLRLQGFRVWLAASGQEALRLYRQHAGEIRAALLDVQMPGLDGPQTLGALREVDPSLPCYFMSGHIGGYTEEGLHQLGARGLIRKPFSLSEVAETLRQAVPDRRRFPRLTDRQYRIHIREGAEAWVRDRSGGGLGLWLPQPLPVRTVIHVRPEEPPSATPWVPVEVRHCRGQDGGWAVGCRFVDPTLSEAQRLAG
jgi:CheY-like chemotaxis protein